MSKPLENIYILDLTQFLSGSYATMILAALGAKVIKAERPKSGDPARASSPFAGPDGVHEGFQSPEDMSLGILKRARNKMSIGLDLKSTRGKEVFFDLVKHVDVVIENYKYGTLESMDITYEKMKHANPSIVYASLTGFGDVEAYKDLPAFDIVVQAMSGIMHVNGTEDMEPMKVGVALGDQPAGLFTALGVLAACIHARETGNGAKVSVSMLDSVLSMLMDEAHDFNLTKGRSVRSGNSLTRLTPFNSYKAGDGYFVIASGGSDKMWNDFLTIMGRCDLIGDERYDKLPERVKRTAEVDAIIQAWANEVSVAEAVDKIMAAGIPVGPVKTVQQAWCDPNLIEAKTLIPVEHRTCGIIPGVYAAQNPIRIKSDDVEDVFFSAPAPTVGEHNDEIYGGLLGYSAEVIASLKSEKII